MIKTFHSEYERQPAHFITRTCRPLPWPQSFSVSWPTASVGKTTIVIGLILFALNSYLFAVANSYFAFIILLIVSGASIGIFKTGALAMIGDITHSTQDHTSTMNMVEGFFGVGAIIGPAIVARLLLVRNFLEMALRDRRHVVRLSACLSGLDRKVPENDEGFEPSPSIFKPHIPYFKEPLRHWILHCMFSLRRGGVRRLCVAANLSQRAQAFFGFYGGLCGFDFLYSSRRGKVPRFLGYCPLALGHCPCRVQRCDSRLLRWLDDWRSQCNRISAGALRLIYVGSYPTMNSKGISCFPKAEHGAISGVLLFFTCAGAALGPLAMGAVSDSFGDLRAGFALATACAGLLFAGLLYNWIANPTRQVLQHSDVTEYGLTEQTIAQ